MHARSLCLSLSLRVRVRVLAGDAAAGGVRDGRLDGTGLEQGRGWLHTRREKARWGSGRAGLYAKRGCGSGSGDCTRARKRMRECERRGTNGCAYATFPDGTPPRVRCGEGEDLGEGEGGEAIAHCTFASGFVHLHLRLHLRRFHHWLLAQGPVRFGQAQRWRWRVAWRVITIMRGNRRYDVHQKCPTRA